MKWCQAHWDGLRTEVKRQGLDSFVPDSGSAAAEMMARAIQGETSIDTFDPLMNAHWAINSFIASGLGEGGFLLVLALEGCPVCKANESSGRDFAAFFVNAVEEQRRLLQAIQNGDDPADAFYQDASPAMPQENQGETP